MILADVFSILLLSVTIVSMILGSLVIQSDSRASANRCFFALVLSISIWSAGLAFANAAPNAVASEIWWRYSAFGRGFVFSALLHFIMIITGKASEMTKPWTILLLHVPAAAVILSYGIPGGLHPRPYQLTHTDFGWINRAGLSGYDFWDWIFLIYFSAYTLAALLLIYRWGRQSLDHNVKRQARIIFLSFAAALFLGGLTDMVLGYSLAKIPQIAPIVLLIPLTALYRSIRRYHFIVPESGPEKGCLIRIMIGVLSHLTISYMQVLLSGGAGMAPPVSDPQAYLGIMTQLQMMISIYLVLKEDSPGYIAAVLLNGGNALFTISNMLRLQSTQSLPGTISYISVLLIVTLIASYKRKTAANIEKIERQKVSLEESEKRLYHMAYYDSLTRLHNRDWFVGHLDESIQRSEQDGSLIGVVFVDLDSFKSINDTMGHSSGDTVLKMIAGRLSSCLKEGDAIARFGGDEFLIMVNGMSDQGELHRVTDRIMDIFNNPITLQHVEYFITASVGAAVYPLDGENSETLIKNADIAMYLAKNKGRNQCVFCSSGMKEETVKKMKLTNDLYKALDDRELFLHYQPQVRAQTREIKGFEALLRWNSKDYGLITPDVFVPMAEHTGLIRPIGLWVFRTACEQLQIFRSLSKNNIGMTINLSLEQLKDTEIAGEISAILDETETDARDIQIEITESTAFNEDPFVLQQVRDIKKLGISVAIDDFGTGFSSFTRLKTFPIDLLKIDIGFVRGISNGSRKDEAIIKSIIQISKNLGIEVLAEGVETEKQYIYLREHGCDLIQGYYFHKPASAEETIRLLKSQAGWGSMRKITRIGERKALTEPGQPG